MIRNKNRTRYEFDLYYIDLTVVDTLNPWLEWYRYKTGHNLTLKGEDHGMNVQKLMINHSVPLDFWRKSDLYDNLNDRFEHLKQQQYVGIYLNLAIEMKIILKVQDRYLIIRQ